MHSRRTGPRSGRSTRRASPRGTATFDTDIPEWEAWDAGHLAGPALVAGTARRSWAGRRSVPVSSRACYRGVAEVSIYVARRGAGPRCRAGLLLEALIAASEQAGIWTLHSSIHADNRDQRALHERCGFRVVGRRERIARRADGWADTIIMERRSAVVGV